MILRALLFLVFLLLTQIASAACSPVGAISTGQILSGQLSSTDCKLNDGSSVDVYTLAGTAGQRISLSLTSSAFDAYLILLDSANNKLDEDDDSGGGTQARIPASGYFSLPSSGSYQIHVNSAMAGETGSYSLSVILENASVVAEVTEFYHSGLDHYFMTADPNEAAGLVGNSALGWIRTGNTFKSGESTPVCRFYGSMSPGPNSHFYTLAGAECDSLKQLQASTPATEKRWNFESLDFSSTPAIDGTCENGTIPVYRAYNAGYAKGVDSNHRMVRKVSAIQDVVDRGWVSEGVVMCAPASTNQGITGGNVVDPGGIASVNVTTGTIPSYVNASGPTLKAVTQLNKGVEFDPAGGEVNVTRGGLGYEFDLTGDSSFVTTAAGAIKISLPVDTSSIPVADRTSLVKIFMRIYNLDTGSNADVTGEIATTGGVMHLTVETRGLPNRFVAMAVYNPNMDATLVDDSTPSSSQAIPDAHEKAATAWPAKAWCVTYNPNNPTLIAQIKAIRGISAAPTREEIRNTISYKLGARKAQLVYERDGFLAPNLYTGKPCGGNTPHYVIHLSEKKSSAYRSGIPDQDEEITADEAPFGRIHVQYSHTGILGDVVAHELHHAIQFSYGLAGDTVRGYKEGTATTYGKTISNNAGISIRESKMQYLVTRLMTPDLQPADPPPPGRFKVGYNGYANQDFFAYIGKQYNNDSLAYISGLYTRMRDDLGNGIMNATLPLLGTSLDTYLKSAFGLGLKDIYLDYVKQRALTHNVSSQLGRAGEVMSGFAENLFGATGVHKQNVNLASCSKTSMQWNGLSPFSTGAIVVNPTGVLPAGSNGLNLFVKITPSAGSAADTLKGFTWRSNTASVLAEDNKFSAFGKQPGDQVVVLVSNLDLAVDGSFTFEIGCDGPAITALSPASGAIDTAVTITGSGFGTAADTRAVYFNGVKAGSVTWNSDTTAVARVPANASSGNVVVEVSEVKSNGLVFTVESAITLAVSPTTASISTGATQTFTATVSGSSNKGLTWSASGGTISSAGLYTAPAVAGTYYVTATSQADTSKKAVATVTVTGSATCQPQSKYPATGKATGWGGLAIDYDIQGLAISDYTEYRRTLAGYPTGTKVTINFKFYGPYSIEGGWATEGEINLNGGVLETVRAPDKGGAPGWSFSPMPVVVTINDAIKRDGFTVYATVSYTRSSNAEILFVTAVGKGCP